MLRLILISILFSLQTNNASFLGVECVPDQKIIRSFLKLNFTDFIFDYRVNINDDQVFDPSGKIDTTEILLSKYLNEKVQIFANGSRLSGKVIKIESSDKLLQVELLYRYKKAKQIKVRNTILTNINVDQSNMLIFKYDDFEEGVKLTPGQTEFVFDVRRH